MGPLFSACTGMTTQALKSGKPDLLKVAEHVFAIEDSWKSLQKELWVPLPLHWVQAASCFGCTANLWCIQGEPGISALGS